MQGQASVRYDYGPYHNLKAAKQSLLKNVGHFFGVLLLMRVPAEEEEVLNPQALSRSLTP